MLYAALRGAWLLFGIAWVMSLSALLLWVTRSALQWVAGGNTGVVLAIIAWGALVVAFVAEVNDQ